MTSVRRAGERDFDALTDVWERAVTTTHAFLTADDVAAMRPHVRDGLLPSMDVWAVEDDGELVAFVGAHDDHVRLLYVDPARHGRGLGSRLLDVAQGERASLRVSVYARNPVGLAFYRSRGFVETGRGTDDLGAGPLETIDLRR